MPNNFWFNRIVEYWVMPQGDELIEHIRRAKVQVVQIGNFGPLLYGLADDPEIERWAAGVPLYGLRENLDLAATQIARCKEAGARVVGQLSMSWHYGDPEPLQQAFALTAEKAANYRRKEAFDGLLAQWYHKYDFRLHDERSLLPPELWAKDESYIWYSQGPWQRASSIAHGYLADMGLPGRFMYAAGAGRPYVINKYDYRRWRIWCGEALAYHAGPPRLDQEQSANIAPEDFYGPVVRYQRFMAAQEKLLQPAKPHTPIALIYPRRSEREAEMDCLDALKRLGRHLEDGHQLFDIVLDDQLLTSGGNYAMLILPEVKRMTREEETFLRQYVANGGKLLFTSGTGSMDLDGNLWPVALLADWRSAPTAENLCGRAESGRVHYLPTGPWIPAQIAIPTLDGAERPVYPLIDQDPFGQQFLAELSAILGESTLATDAPWYVRVHAWRPEQVDALVLHWINYRQDEDSAVEIPLPTGPIQVDCAVPDGRSIDRVEWLYPEMRAAVELEYSAGQGRVRFEIPTLIVYGMGVLYLGVAD